MQIKNPMTIIQGGGGTRPTTWAEFAAMTTADMQMVYGIGDRVGIACPWTSTSDATVFPDISWQIAGWGTTRKENDSTDYPCVTLVAERMTNGVYSFDAPETTVAATEETAQDGLYYFGYNGSSYTSLNLNTGDTIPYSSYTAVYKSDITDNASRYSSLLSYGLPLYKYSAIRQWLNSDGAADSWWQASHIGDASPSYANQAGFMSGLDSGFKAILQPTEVVTSGNNIYDDGSYYSTYDYLFLPSKYETYQSTPIVEGDRMGCFAIGTDENSALRTRSCMGTGSASNPNKWWLRTPNVGNAASVFYIPSSGGSSDERANTTMGIVPACKIILTA